MQIILQVSIYGLVKIFLRVETSAPRVVLQGLVRHRGPRLPKHRGTSLPLFRGQLRRKAAYFICDNQIRPIKRTRESKKERILQTLIYKYRSFCYYYKCFLIFASRYSSEAISRFAISTDARLAFGYSLRYE